MRRKLRHDAGAAMIVTALTAALAGCDRRVPEPGPDPGVATTATAAASAAMGAAASEDPRGALVPADDAKTAIEQTARALAAIRTDQAAARDAFRTLGNFCVGEAGLAYLAWEAHDADAAAAHLARAGALPEPARCWPSDEPSLGDKVLRALRGGLDKLHESGELPPPCEVFEAHPEEALRAWAPFWGSTLDLPALDAEHRCAEASIRNVLPADQVPRASAALRDAAASLFQVVHEPSGTLWISSAAAAGTVIAQGIIAPEVFPANPDLDARVARAVTKAEPRVRDIRKRVAAFSAVRARESAVLGDVICGVLARRAVAAPAGGCRRRAEDVMTLALVQWLEQAPWEAFYMEGAP
jgi:hypothetical protein